MIPASSNEELTVLCVGGRVFLLVGLGVLQLATTPNIKDPAPWVGGSSQR